MVFQYYQIIGIIDEYITSKRIDVSVVNDVVKIIREDKDALRYYFNYLQDYKWFIYLFNEDLFNPNNIPISEGGVDQYWFALAYLEKVSAIHENNPNLSQVVDIIISVLEYSENIMLITNSQTWWSIVKIINNLPLQIIIDHYPISGENGFNQLINTICTSVNNNDLPIQEAAKLLIPKFIKDVASMPYAEIIVNAIADIKPGKQQKTFLTQREEAVMRWASYWLLESISKHSKEIGLKCSGELLFSIADKLKKALQYKYSDMDLEIEVNGKEIRIDVSRIKPEELKENEIEFKDNEYYCRVGQYSDKQLEDIDKDKWLLRDTEPENKLFEFQINASDKKSFISEIIRNVKKKPFLKEITDIEKRIGNLFDNLHEDYSQIWVKSLVEYNPINENGAIEVLTVMLRDILKSKCESNPDQGKQILEILLSDKYPFPIFRKIVLMIINKQWDEDLFVNFMNLYKNPFEELDFEVELQDILKNHWNQLQSETKSKISGFIDDIPEYYKEDEKASAFWKYRWYSPLSEYPEFKDKYQDMKYKAGINQEGPYIPERTMKGSSGWVRNLSPKSKEEILKMTVAELVHYIKDFKGNNKINDVFEQGPNGIGLAEEISFAIIEQPEHFSSDISKFLDTNYLYISHIIRAYKDLFKAGKETDWEKVFQLIIDYLNKGKEFILREANQFQEYKTNENRYLQIVSDIVDLIDEGCRNDQRAFETKYFDTFSSIFNLILPILKEGDLRDGEKEAVNFALNTTFGRTVQAYIIFSLRVKRSGNTNGWKNEVYNQFLQIGVEAFVWLGRYIAQIQYLNDEYARRKISEMADLPISNKKWKFFMDGYLFGSQVYKGIYPLMRNNYKKALDCEWNQNVEEDLVEHICIAYFHTGELLKENNDDGSKSLFWKMLNDTNSNRLSGRLMHIVSYFWSISNRQEPEKVVKDKIIEFWRWLYDTDRESHFLKAVLNDKYEAFLGKLILLTLVLDKIDNEKKNWVMMGAPYALTSHNGSFFVQYLAKFTDDESLMNIADIILKMVESSVPYYGEEEIYKIVENIYQISGKHLDVKEKADEICNTFGRRGNHFLRELWKKNNSK